MLKKFIYFLLAMVLVLLICNAVYATDISLNSNQNVQNEIVEGTNIPEESTTDFLTPSTSIADYEDSTELSISNIINIILIAVGIVLILLGIAIIIRLK